MLRALQAFSEPAGARWWPVSGLEVVSDSAYVVNCIRQRWWEGWFRRNWRNAQGKPVANRDLWEQLFALALEPPRPLTFRWVQSHGVDKWNDFADRLAVEAASSGQGTSGLLS